MTGPGDDWQRPFEEPLGEGGAARDEAPGWRRAEAIPEDAPIRFDETPETSARPAGRARRKGPAAGLWFVGGSLAFLVLAGAYETVGFTARVLREAPPVGLVLLTLLGLALAGLGLLVTREILALRRLRRILRLHEAVARRRASHEAGAAIALAESIADDLQETPELAGRRSRFRDSCAETHSGEEVFTLFSREVLAGVDRDAARIVRSGARQTGVAVAVSPLVVVDVGFALWRTLRMVREIAALYGARPGMAGTLRLLREIAASLLYSGVSEMLADIGAGSLAPLVSRRLAQGFGAGLFTARVGVRAMALCRPVPFAPGEAPRVRDIAGAVRRDLRDIRAGEANERPG